MQTQATRDRPTDGQAAVADLDPATRLQDWGFLANPDLPDRPGPAFLLVALRNEPTLRHYDPETIDYWVSSGDRGRRRRLSRSTPMPLSEPFSWGMIRLVDRIHVSNEYLTFGGRLDAAMIDGAIVAVFTSPVPLLRRGGHSQGWDAGADLVGAFFGRLMVAVDFSPGFEATLAAASPVTRYAAFVRDSLRRLPADAATDADRSLTLLIRHEASRLRSDAAADWQGGERLLDATKGDER
jgi:hypothetical protein